MITGTRPQIIDQNRAVIRQGRVADRGQEITNTGKTHPRQINQSGARGAAGNLPANKCLMRAQIQAVHVLPPLVFVDYRKRKNSANASAACTFLWHPPVG